MSQLGLFNAEEDAGPAGLRFVPDFLGEEEAAALVRAIEVLPLEEARYKGYVARRRVASYGTRFDFDALALRRSEPVPAGLMPTVLRVARFLGVAPEAFANLLVSEYRPGTPLGWHRDVPDFESIVGLSVLGTATMRFRRYPHRPGIMRSSVFRLVLPPRSLYVIEGAARWEWQHSVLPTTEQRYSLTLRTPRGAPGSLLRARAVTSTG